MKSAFLFPGQGSQYVGMAKEFFDKLEESSKIFLKADSALGFKISDICFIGPEENLKLTENAQPALLTASIAILQEVKKIINPDVVAGHSLGEYSALVAAGALNFPDAVKIVRKRGEFMKAASGGAMAAILALSREKIEEICKRASSLGIVAPANFNCPGQIVISGEKNAVDEACKLAKENGGKAILLAVSGPFHSSLMKQAKDKLEAEISKFMIEDPKCGFIANVTADYVKDAATVKDLLVKQVVSCVLWEDSINLMIKDGVDLFVEIGPGKVLSGLVKRIKKDARIYNIENMETLNKFKTEISVK